MKHIAISLRRIKRLLCPFVAALFFVAAASSPVLAAPMHHHGGGAGGAKNASTRAYIAAMQTMHKNMDVAKAGDPDVDFVRQMIPHHQGAIAMAKIQLKYGQDEKLKALTRWIIAAQEREIGFMKNWLNRRDTGEAVPHARDYYGAAMQAMHHGMNIRYTGDADRDFVRGMIAHHQGAVDMASVLMAEGSDPDLKPLAGDIFSSQTAEIAWMQGWLAEHAPDTK